MRSSECLDDRELSKEEAHALYKKYIEPQRDPDMVALWTQFEAGEKKGRLEGELKRARSVLQQLLTQRFGSLSPEYVARLEAASLAYLDAMTLRVLTAGSIDEVLGATG